MQSMTRDNWLEALLSQMWAARVANWGVDRASQKRPEQMQCEKSEKRT